MQDSPRWGRVLLSGRVRKLPPEAAAEHALTFAEANPVGDLLDLGLGTSLYAIDVDRIRLFGRSGTADIDPGSYAAAAPDPLHEHERDLLLDLSDHHVPQITAYFRELLDNAGMRYGPHVRAVRLDRYGFLVNLDHAGGVRPRFARLSFTRPVRCRHELARLLHPVLFSDTYRDTHRDTHGDDGTADSH